VKKPDTDLVDDGEITAMLRGLAGSAEPVRRTSRPPRSLVRTAATFVAAAALLLPALALARWVADHGSSGSAACADAVTFDGRPYVGHEIRTSGDVRAAAGVGVATTVYCDDTGDTPGDGTPARPVRMRGVQGIDPEVALMSRELSHVVYVAVGRCADLRFREELSGCLRERLDLQGRRYSRFRVHEDHGPAPEQVGAPFLATLSTPAVTARVSVRKIQGIAAVDAVSAEADPRNVYVVDGRCYVGISVDLLSCLRDAG